MNKTKNPSQKSLLRRVYNPRYHSNCETEISPLSGLRQALCLYAAIRKESTCFRFRSFDSEVMGHWNVLPLARSNRQLSPGSPIRPSSSQSFFEIFKCKSIILHQNPVCQGFFANFLAGRVFPKKFPPRKLSVLKDSFYIRSNN